jgi:hypothetical protein
VLISHIEKLGLGVDLVHKDVVVVTVDIQGTARNVIWEEVIERESALGYLGNCEVIRAELFALVELTCVLSYLLLDEHHSVRHFHIDVVLVDLATDFVWEEEIGELEMRWDRERNSHVWVKGY